MLLTLDSFYRAKPRIFHVNSQLFQSWAHGLWRSSPEKDHNKIYAGKDTDFDLVLYHIVQISMSVRHRRCARVSSRPV